MPTTVWNSSFSKEATMTVCQVVVNPWALNLNALLAIIFGTIPLLMQICLSSSRLRKKRPTNQNPNTDDPETLRHPTPSRPNGIPFIAYNGDRFSPFPIAPNQNGIEANKVHQSRQGQDQQLHSQGQYYPVPSGHTPNQPWMEGHSSYAGVVNEYEMHPLAHSPTAASGMASGSRYGHALPGNDGVRHRMQ